MLGNNISNKQAPYVLFDIDSLLFEDKEENIWGKIMDKLRSENSKYLKRPINKKFTRGVLDRVWRNHNVSIGLVTFQQLDEDEARELENTLSYELVNYTRLFVMSDWEELRDFNRYGSLYTFSDNEELISYLSDSGSMKLDKIWEVM